MGDKPANTAVPKAIDSSAGSAVDAKVIDNAAVSSTGSAVDSSTDSTVAATIGSAAKAIDSSAGSDTTEHECSNLKAMEAELKRLAPDKPHKWGGWASLLERENIKTLADLYQKPAAEFTALPLSGMLRSLLDRARQADKKRRRDEAKFFNYDRKGKKARLIGLDTLYTLLHFEPEESGDKLEDELVKEVFEALSSLPPQTKLLKRAVAAFVRNYHSNGTVQKYHGYQKKLEVAKCTTTKIFKALKEFDPKFDEFDNPVLPDLTKFRPPPPPAASNESYQLTVQLFVADAPEKMSDTDPGKTLPKLTRPLPAAITAHVTADESECDALFKRYLVGRKMVAVGVKANGISYVRYSKATGGSEKVHALAFCAGAHADHDGDGDGGEEEGGVVIIVQIGRMAKLPAALVSLLQDKSVIKTGFFSRGLLSDLARDYAFPKEDVTEKALVPLAWLGLDEGQVSRHLRISEFGDLDVGGESDVHRQAQRRVVVLSNWCDDPLSPVQVRCIALQALKSATAAYNHYHHFQEQQQTGGGSGSGLEDWLDKIQKSKPRIRPQQQFRDNRSQHSRRLTNDKRRFAERRIEKRRRPADWLQPADGPWNSRRPADGPWNDNRNRNHRRRY